MLRPIFLSIDNGIVLKVITIYNPDTDSMEEVMLEELQVFKVSYFFLLSYSTAHIDYTQWRFLDSHKIDSTNPIYILSGAAQDYTLQDNQGPVSSNSSPYMLCKLLP